MKKIYNVTAHMRINQSDSLASSPSISYWMSSIHIQHAFVR
jgi:hypothetical protein